MAHWQEHALSSGTANNSCNHGTTVYNALMQQAQNGSTVEPQVSVVTLSKLSGRALNASQRDKQLAVLISTVLNVKTARAGWNLEVRPNSFKTVELGGNDYRNEVSLNLWNSKPENATAKTTDVVIRQIHQAGGASSGSNKWRVAEVDGVTWDAPERDADGEGEAIDPDKELVTYADCFIPDNADTFFDGLYGVDAQVNMVMRPLERAVSSDFTVRINSLLAGPPACGKSEALTRIVNMVGEAAALKVDATAVTAAGFQAILKDRPMMPRVIIVEEIEKGSEDFHRVLLAVTDDRAELRRITARGNTVQDCKVVLYATCNDVDAFKKSVAGALYSRCNNRVGFSKCEPEVLARIINDKLDRVGEDHKITPKVMDYCSRHGINDVREMIALAMCGGTDWLNGTYEAELNATREGL